MAHYGHLEVCDFPGADWARSVTPARRACSWGASGQEEPDPPLPLLPLPLLPLPVLPVLAVPAWRNHRTAPIDERDIVEMLAAAADNDQVGGMTLDVGGPGRPG